MNFMDTKKIKSFVMLSLLSALFFSATAFAGELGEDDFRISETNTDGDEQFDAFDPDVAYNSTDDEYLVVWHANDDTGDLAADKSNIYGKIIDANGDEIVAQFRISIAAGPDNDGTYDTFSPKAVYNPTNNEYLVIWAADDDTSPLTDDKFEVFGQILNADGEALVSPEFRISHTSPDDDSAYAVSSNHHDLAYDATNNNYLVVWSGDTDVGDLEDGEFEIWGQLLADDGTQISGDFRISDMGTDGDITLAATDPQVAYGNAGDNYVVVWRGEEDVDSETEIWGQVLTADGSDVGDDFRISTTADDGDTEYDALMPGICYNSHDDQYLVIWAADDNSGTLVDEEFEIFGKLFDADGAAADDQFRITNFGSDGSGIFTLRPVVACNNIDNQFLVAFEGNLDVLKPNEIQVQRLDNTGTAIGDAVQISSTNADDIQDEESVPAIAYNGTLNQYLVVWYGDETTEGLASAEYEIWGQLYNEPECGNGVVDEDSDETCDDGDANSDTVADACRTSCTAAVCGDGVTDTGEECDDGNTDETDDCDNSCVVIADSSGSSGGCQLAAQPITGALSALASLLTSTLALLFCLKRRVKT